MAGDGREDRAGRLIGESAQSMKDWFKYPILLALLALAFGGGYLLGPKKGPAPPEKKAFLTMAERSKADHDLPPGVRMKAERNGLILQRSLQYRADGPGHPELAALRAGENLESVVSAGNSEFEKTLLLLAWTNRQWVHGMARPYPPWNANVILEMIRTGKTGGYCGQYAVVFAQACLALGWKARYLEIVGPKSGHFMVEVWSNQYNRWVAMDPDCANYFESGGIPLSGLEIHDLVSRGMDASIRKVPAGPNNNPEVCSQYSLSSFMGIAVDLRNDYMSRPGYFMEREMSYLAWKDEFTDGTQGPYGYVTEDPLEFNFPLNQVHVTVVKTRDPHELSCRIRTNMDDMDHLIVRIDGGLDQKITNPFISMARETQKGVGIYITAEYGAVIDYRWNIHRGENKITIKAVNGFGVAGPPATLAVESL